MSHTADHPRAIRDMFYDMRRQRERLLIFVVVGFAFLLSAAYVLSRLKTGWLPEDDGILAQSAFRVLRMQLPHRDFVETYTGGLSCLNALAFRLFGVNLLAMRMIMFIVFLAWLPAVFYVASRFLSPIPASAVVVLATVWGVPNYPTPMPSWYNMFFAIMGAAAIMRYLEDEHRGWLVLAGVCGGLSVLVKIIGLYYIAAVLLFLVYREQLAPRTEGTEQPRHGVTYRIFIIVGLLSFLSIIMLLMRHQFDKREFVHFFLPSSAMVGLLIWNEIRRRQTVDDIRRFCLMFQIVMPFALGVALPILAFLVPYIRSGTLDTFTRGTLSDGVARAQSFGALVRPEHLHSMVHVIPLLTIIAAGVFWKKKAGPLLVIPVTCAGIVLLVASFRSSTVTQDIWFSAALSTPVFVCLGAWLILLGPTFADGLSPKRQQQVVLMLTLVAVCSLVQFPFSAKIYFCYFAPLLVLAVTAVVASAKRASNPHVLACVLVFYTLFAVLRVAPSMVYDNGGFKTAPILRSMNLERAGGVRVEGAQMYEEAVRRILEHAGGGSLIATPNCPEVYFLSGLRNSTTNDNALTPEVILHAIQNNGDVNVVVINGSSVFAQSTLTPEVFRVVSENFPIRVNVGKYWICWRLPSGASGSTK